MVIQIRGQVLQFETHCYCGHMFSVCSLMFAKTMLMNNHNYWIQHGDSKVYVMTMVVEFNTMTHSFCLIGSGCLPTSYNWICQIILSLDCGPSPKGFLSSTTMKATQKFPRSVNWFIYIYIYIYLYFHTALWDINSNRFTLNARVRARALLGASVWQLFYFVYFT